jgi:hypothetical protein
MSVVRCKHGCGWGVDVSVWPEMAKNGDYDCGRHDGLFTWDDVVVAKEAAFELRMARNRPAADKLDALANRIASLLPPTGE